MKPLLFIALLGMAAAGLRGESLDERVFGSVGTDYKKPQVLNDSFFNPFKAQAPESILQKQESASVTNEAVGAAIGHRGISGLVYATAGETDKVIIGDQVFSIGDELEFPPKDATQDGPVPLVSGASIVLREVKAQSLTFEITPEGEASRQLVYPLRGFWRP
jgi:hypothetical protein